jgi:hypothetical protein
MRMVIQLFTEKGFANIPLIVKNYPLTWYDHQSINMETIVYLFILVNIFAEFFVKTLSLQ